ncbi:MAG: outer membrane protein assembly factor BamA [Phycisphaerales bacterium]|nr:MAG: outer membrane protein assembly factor BamA [Phycisphaerales bacterium]
MRAFCGLCCLAGWMLVPVSAVAQSGPADTVKSIEYEGLGRTGQAVVNDIVRVRAGDTLDTRALDGAVTRLLRTGRFLGASYTLDEQADGVAVTFHLHERPVVSSLRFSGNEKFSVSQLKEKVDVRTGTPVDWFAVRDGRDAIVEAYREAGYGDVVVTFDREELERTGELVYLIEEGPRVRIREIVFEGSTAFSRGKLKRQVETKTAFWFFRAGAFDEDRAESDVLKLQQFYRDQGFLDARVSYRRETIEDGEDLRVVFAIDEGVRYAIEAIEFRGNTALADGELIALTASQVGRTVKRPQVDADIRTVRSAHWELGYLYAAVGAQQVFSDKPGLVRITIEIEEGEQFRVGMVAVRGNTRTKDKVVRRALNLYPPDDLFDLNEATRAERRLLETRIFGAARVLPVGDSPGVRDIVIDVQEAEKSGDFLFGAGVTSNSGFVGNFVLDLQNFDLFDWPRSLSELIKFRSFFGAGQHFRMELQPGTDLNRFRMDFTEPYLFDKPIRFDTSMFLFERGRDGYAERRGGGSISLGKRFERGRLRGWSAEVALRAESVRIGDVDLFAARDIREDEGSNFQTSVKLTAVRDRTDSRFLPSVGDRLRFGYEQFGILGGDFTFGKATARYQWYKTLKTDALDRKSVLQLRAEGGAIIGDAPVYERFFTGGAGSIRGFEFRGIGPRQGLDRNNVGGDYLVLLGAEYTYPFIGENIRGHVFVDSGTVGSGTYRVALGTGIRLTINFLGPVPLEFNLAVPILADDEDEEQIFSFLVSGLF